MKNRLFLCILIALISLSLAGCDTGSSISTEPETSVSISTEPVISVSVSTEPEVSVSVSEETQVSTETQDNMDNAIVESSGRNIAVAFQNDCGENIWVAIQDPLTGEQVVLQPELEPNHTLTLEFLWNDEIELLSFAFYRTDGELLINSVSVIDMTKVESKVTIVMQGEENYESFDVKKE